LLGCGGGSSGPKPLGQIGSCLRSAGFGTHSTIGVPDQLALTVPQRPQMTVYTVTINKTAKDAQQQVGDQKAEFGPQGANLGGGAVGQGRVVIAYARPVLPSDLDKVKHCAF
jgi:hypothetical protein